MKKLKKEDREVVEKWWECSSKALYKKGYILKKYRPPVDMDCCKYQGNGKSFEEILEEVGVGKILANATCRNDGSPVELAVWGYTAPGFRVHNSGYFRVVATPIDPPAPLWRRSLQSFRQP